MTQLWESQSLPIALLIANVTLNFFILMHSYCESSGSIKHVYGKYKEKLQNWVISLKKKPEVIEADIEPQNQPAEQTEVIPEPAA